MVGKLIAMLFSNIVLMFFDNFICLKILESLETSENHHMSAEDIYRTLIMQNEEVGVATIYRVLTQFEASGMVNATSC
jgi:Fe2+ or Zn2+ uptake regulation protein